jgi:hypothetical protein
LSRGIGYAAQAVVRLVFVAPIQTNHVYQSEEPDLNCLTIRIRIRQFALLAPPFLRAE